MRKDLITFYPIIITKTNDKYEPYFVSLPDFKGFTEGTSIINAIDMAKDYVGTASMDKLDDKEKIPQSNHRVPKIQNPKRQFVTLITVNVSEYKRHYDNKAVKKTVNIPNNLNELGKKKKVNFSKLLTEALIKELNISNHELISISKI